MELKFFSIDEVKDFVKQLKGTRGGKNEADETSGATGNAPAPLQPPQGGQAFNPGGGPGFVPPAGGATQVGGAFPAAGATGLAPEVQALVTRIVTRIDGAVASGQSVDAMLGWFRNNIGDPTAAAATMDQIKTVYLPKTSVPVLENIAKLMAA